MNTYFFLILGMHRSGTSFLTRCLNSCGVYLGKEQSIIAVRPGNPKGQWENRNFVNLSDQLLNENQGSWHVVPEQISCSKELRIKFENEIKKLVSEAPIAAGLKDPRTVIILDSIKDILPNNNIYIGIFRHPLKVAESLKTRNDFDYEKSLMLWQKYNQKLLNYLENRNSFLINFDWTREKLFGEIDKIIKKTGLIKTDLNSVYSYDLFHSDKSYNQDYEIPPKILETYSKLKEYSEKNDLVRVDPIRFTIDESREIMAKMLEQINELSEPEKTKLSESFYPDKRKTSRKNRLLKKLGIK